MTYTSGQRSIMAEIINYYGHEPQKMMLLEEMAELQKEICKDMRYDPDLEAITEEVADVLIMLEQIQMMYHISETKLHKITNEKLRRQLRRIEDEKSGIIRRIRWRDETSQLLQDAGYEDASKYLDAAWEL